MEIKFTAQQYLRLGALLLSVQSNDPIEKYEREWANELLETVVTQGDEFMQGVASADTNLYGLRG